jgi:hypothetical protein
MLETRFGLWRVKTALANVADATSTGPYQPVKTIGPPHLSLSDRGLAFATNDREGLCIRFHEPVRGLDPLGIVRHPAITVTVDDVNGLASCADKLTQLTTLRDPDSPSRPYGARRTSDAEREDAEATVYHSASTSGLQRPMRAGKVTPRRTLRSPRGYVAGDSGHIAAHAASVRSARRREATA